MILRIWMPLYVGIKLRVKKMGNIYLFRVKALVNFLLPFIWGRSWSKILFAHEVFHFSDSPRLLKLLLLNTLLSCKWLILLLVILANINSWLSLLTKHTWVSCGTKSCLHVISYLSTICGVRKRKLTHIPVNPMWLFVQQRNVNGFI